MIVQTNEYVMVSDLINVFGYTSFFFKKHLTPGRYDPK